MKKAVISIGSFFALPIFLIAAAIKSHMSGWKKFWYILLIILFIGVTWVQGYFEIILKTSTKLYSMGIIDTLKNVHVSGTSMLPTILDGSMISLHNPNKYSISYGDVVSFNNLETGNLNYIKRVIGMPGDSVVIKNGTVSVNGQVLSEPYTYEQFPTYGNTFLLDCREYTVPVNSYMLLGDNRTVSMDSRVLGFVDKKNIRGIIKSDIQPEFQNTAAPAKQASMASAVKIVERINTARTVKQQPPLISNPKLDAVAAKRAEYVKNNPEDWKMQQDINQFLTGQKYGYNLAHEYVTFGYLTDQQIFNQINESVVDKEYMLSPKFYEIGIGTTTVTSQACTYPVTVIILSWPSNPTYSSEILTMWKQEVDALSKIIPEMQKYVGAPGLNQNQLKTIINKLSEVSEIANRVYTKIKANEWLTDKDNQDIERYPKLSTDLKSLMEKEFPAALPGGSSPSQGSTNQQTSPNAASSAPVNTKFKSAGQVIVETGVTGTINSAVESGNTIKIHVTFANTTGSTQTIYPVRVSMNSLSHGTMPVDFHYLDVPIRAHEITAYDFTYDKIPNPPFTFKYLGTSGSWVTLGTYTP